MTAVLSEPAIGFVVGLLVGLTGVGGGVILLPALLFLLNVPTLVAVGSAAACSFLSKVTAGVLHWRQGTVDRQLVCWLAVGSIPASLLGLLLLARLRTSLGVEVGGVLNRVIAVLLIVIPIFTAVQALLGADPGAWRKYMPSFITLRTGAAAVGFIGGFLVGLTSIGAGSIIMMLMLLFLTRPPDVLVGSDVVHAVILSLVTSVGHVLLANVDFGLVGRLLLGAVPGVLLGTRLVRVVPAAWLRTVIQCLLVVVGVAML